MDKKAQEGVTLTTILLMVVGVVVVVLVIMFATGFFDKLNSGVDAAGSKLDIAVKACELAGSSNLKADYCLKFREVEVNGESIYVTCTDKVFTNLIDSNKISATMTCSPLVEKDVAEYCRNEKLSGTQKISLNDAQTKTCGELVKAYPAPTPASTPTSTPGQ